MDLESILGTIQPFIVMFVAAFAAFLTATWIAAVIWAFRDIRARSRDVFAQVLATLLVFVFFPLFPVPGLLLYMILRPRETLAEVYERSLEEEVLLQGIEERLACPGCNRRIETDFMICPACHTRLKKACPECGRLLHLRWNLCPYCGAPQTTARPGVAAAPVAMVVEPPERAPVRQAIPLQAEPVRQAFPLGPNAARETVPLQAEAMPDIIPLQPQADFEPIPPPMEADPAAVPVQAGVDLQTVPLQSPGEVEAIPLQADGAPKPSRPRQKRTPKSPPPQPEAGRETLPAEIE